VQCGTLPVPENYQQAEDTKIAINFTVLPAIDNSQNKTPLIFLAGGPGQAAVELADRIYKGFREIRKTRDLILIDQRGTGKSHPLQCPDTVDYDVYKVLPEDYSEQDVKDCLAQLSGDLSQYNSENAIRDFEQVREALGHEKVNIYGGSYGTRAALVYMRLFPGSLESVILDSVGPIEVPIGLFGQSGARSFALLLANCRKEATCQKAYPNLAEEFKQVVARLEAEKVTLTIPHPRLGESTTFAISSDKFVSTLRMQLYSVSSRSLVPLIIHQAYLGNYLPLAGMVATTDGNASMYIGLTFNIVCNEDMPRISQETLMADADNDFGGDNSHKGFTMTCPTWPKYTPSADFYQPVTANVPTLILSGDLDPVTPPSNGELSNKTLPNSHHIVVKNNSHIVAKNICAVNVVNEFLTSLKPKELDESCLAELPEESFMTSLNGSI
jgi:pimeloyl-ACP methyl ester carboxylesterase